MLAAQHVLRCAAVSGSLPARLCVLAQAVLPDRGGHGMASGTGPATATPPPDLSRAGTADLCDVHVPEPVDKITHARVAIMEPIFRHAWHFKTLVFCSGDLTGSMASLPCVSA